jgi:hypothetical protein
MKYHTYGLYEIKGFPFIIRVVTIAYNLCPEKGKPVERQGRKATDLKPHWPW